MDSIRGLIPFVRKAGELAAERQGTVLRSFKADGSVLTEVDREVDTFLRDSIISLFPGSGVVTEEHSPADTGEPAGPESSSFVFAVDPIDGTDCFSQGMPGWCVSVGVLDEERRPAAGILYAPSWGPDPPGGSFLFADLGARALLNDEEISPLEGKRPGAPQVFAGSSIHRRFRFDTFPGKVRSAGSTVIHIIAPLIHRVVVGTIFSPNYIWDILGAHAVVRSCGLEMEYLDGRPIDYRRLVGRERAEGVIVAGTKEGVELIRATFRPL